MDTVTTLEQQRQALSANIFHIQATIDKNRESIHLLRDEIERLAQEKQVEIDKLDATNHDLASEQEQYRLDIANIELSLDQLQQFPMLQEQVATLIAEKGVITGNAPAQRP